MRPLILFLCIFIAAPALACQREALPPGAERQIDVARFDQGLLDAALRREANFARCRRGLRPLQPSNARLIAEEAAHSEFMMRARKLTHDNTIRGSRTAQDRVKRAGIRARSGSENIGTYYRFRIDGLSFKVRDASSCRFSTWEGQPLGPHSYETLAATIIAFWSQSPGHAANLFGAKYTNVAAGAAFDASGPHCGQIWVAQLYYR